MFTLKFSSIYSGVSELRSFVSNLLTFFYIKVYLFSILGLNFLNWLFVYIINSKVSQDLTVLHYNVDFGVNLIGSVKQIYIIPFLGLIIFILNLILLAFAFRLNFRIPSAGKFFAHILLGASMLANFFLFLSLVFIYLVNFYR